MRLVLALGLVTLGFCGACAWPPGGASLPAAPSPAAAGDAANGAVNPVADTASQTAGAVAGSVPRIQAPVMSVPTVSRGRLLGR
jgi:hypothetical protein